MDRLDENVKEEADGIHNSLGKDKVQRVILHSNDHRHRGEHDGTSTNSLY